MLTTCMSVYRSLSFHNTLPAWGAIRYRGGGDFQHIMTHDNSNKSKCCMFWTLSYQPFLHTHTYTPAHTQTHTDTYTHTHIHAHTHAHTYPHTHIHTHISTHTHTHTHIHAHVIPQRWFLKHANVSSDIIHPTPQ